MTICSPHEVGGKTLIPVPDWMRSTAVFGGVNDEYRYTLSRTWDDSLPSVLVVMMNPSTASVTHNDQMLQVRVRLGIRFIVGR
jgi:hypothetical protein